MSSIRTILDNHIPELDCEVKDYIESLVKSAFDDGDVSHLRTTLKEFLSIDDSQSIIAEVQAHVRKNHSNMYSDKLKLVSLDGQSSVSSQECSNDSSIDASTKSLDDSHESFMLIPSESTSESASKRKSKSKLRKDARDSKKKDNLVLQTPFTKTPNKIEEDFGLVNDDHASAWKECKQTNRVWGGRGCGGRGIRITGDNFDSIHLPCVSLCYEGNELLVDSTMDIIKGHRYALLGRNGVGKSTLLRQIESGNIPGLPRGLVVRFVKQQVEGDEGKTALQALIEADKYRSELLKEQEKVEDEIDNDINIEQNVRRLEELTVELDFIDADNAEQRALDILRGLSFSEEIIYSETMKLSGGWRMRLALAQALFVPCDLLLLDEVTNHLDLHGMAWLESYLTDEGAKVALTLICVSHDRNFLDAVCTDMIVMEHKRLTYHVGNYSDYRQKMEEKAARESQILDAAERQRTKAIAFVEKQQNSKKSTDPNKQRQARMIKEKKLDRLGNYREDGKRYKTKSLSKLSEEYLRLPEKVKIEVDDPVFKLKFPNPLWPRSIADGSPIVMLEDVSFHYKQPSNRTEKYLLQHVTVNITGKTKVAVVGKNGSGKTTLLKLLSGELKPLHGKIWVHANLRLKTISQYSVEALEQYSNLTVIQYAENMISHGRASSDVTSKASGNIRQYLGAFGLGGSHANRSIRKLSGGERMRLCFATALADSPHLLLLDESTNHVDLETLDSLSKALCAYEGAVVMVSHNQGFLSGFCNELWELDENTKKLIISQDDTQSFDDLFSIYRTHVFSSSRGVIDRQKERQMRSGMAKKAAKLSATAKANTALI